MRETVAVFVGFAGIRPINCFEGTRVVNNCNFFK
jgi:hypothetical protein